MLKLLVFAGLLAAISAANLDLLKCLGICNAYCPYGHTLGANGCPTCGCKEAPLKIVEAETGCAPVLCKMFCFNGWAKNEQGCDICKCA